jgi:hypothetical protein
LTCARLPTAVGGTLTFLLIEAAAIAITAWSRRPGWGDRQILALAAGSLFAYAWHAFVNRPPFDSAPIVIVRISNHPSSWSPYYDCLAASRLARYSRSPSSSGLSASYLASASEFSFDLVLANLAVTFTAALAAK